MRLYRIVIRPVMSFTSLLQGDTLFGAFCWSYRYCYGEEKLTELLNRMCQGEPEIIFSNAFPEGTLPLPLGIRDENADFESLKTKEERKQAYQEHKKLKNARYVSRQWFDQIQKGIYREFTKGLVDEGRTEQTIIHNMVSRQDNVVKNLDGSGSLYEENEFFMDIEGRYDVYIMSDISVEILKKVIDLMFLLGIGKNKSTGKGAFEVVEWQEEQELLQCNDANAFMALSNFIPSHQDPVKGRYKIMVKYGKLDREYAMSSEPFKKPLLFLMAGAVFFDNPVKKYYGRCMKDVSIKNEVVTNAYTIAVPLKNFSA